MYENGKLPNSALATIPGTVQRVRKDLLPQVVALRSAFATRFRKALTITDGYRSYAEQVIVRKKKGEWAAIPGTSNHGWGVALDLGSEVNIENSEEYLWLKENGSRFGLFHPLWAEDHNPKNGRQEPWHWELEYIYMSATPEDQMDQAVITAIYDLLNGVGAGDASRLAAKGEFTSADSVLGRLETMQRTLNDMQAALGTGNGQKAVSRNQDTALGMLKDIREAVQ